MPKGAKTPERPGAGEEQTATPSTSGNSPLATPSIQQDINLLSNTKLPTLPKFQRTSNYFRQAAHVDDYFSQLELQLNFLGISSPQRRISASLITAGDVFIQIWRNEKNRKYPAGVTATSPNYADREYEVFKLTILSSLRPRQNEYYFRHEFVRRFQKSGESVTEFSIELFNIARFCEFGDTEDGRVVEQIIHGLASSDLRQKVFEARPIPRDSQSLLELCCTFEDSKHQSNIRYSSTSAPTTTTSVNATHSQRRSRNPPRNNNHGNNGNGGKYTCNRCGKEVNGNHRQTCFVLQRGLKCAFCKRKGHIAAVCYKKNGKPGSTSSSSNAVDESSTDNGQSSSNAVYVSDSFPTL